MNKMAQRLLYIIIFTTAFALVGWFIPNTYYKYFDATKYYEVLLPIRVEQRDYRPGDYINVYFTRKIKIDGTGCITIQLNLVHNDSDIVERVGNTIKEIAFAKTDGFQTILFHWETPNDIPAGEYYFDGSVTYTVRGIEKNHPIKTSVFKVI